MKKESIKAGSQALAKVVEEHIEANSHSAKDLQIIEFIGGAKVISKLTASLTSQLLLSLKRFQETEGYKEIGRAHV